MHRVRIFQKRCGLDSVALAESQNCTGRTELRPALDADLSGYGKERHLAAIVAMGEFRADSFLFPLDRDVDFRSLRDYEEAIACHFPENEELAKFLAAHGAGTVQR